MLRTFVTHAGLDVGQDLIEIFATNCFRRESPMIHQDMNTWWEWSSFSKNICRCWKPCVKNLLIFSQHKPYTVCPRYRLHTSLWLSRGIPGAWSPMIGYGNETPAFFPMVRGMDCQAVGRSRHLSKWDSKLQRDPHSCNQIALGSFHPEGPSIDRKTWDCMRMESNSRVLWVYPIWTQMLWRISHTSLVDQITNSCLVTILLADAFDTGLSDPPWSWRNIPSEEVQTSSIVRTCKEWYLYCSKLIGGPQGVWITRDWKDWSPKKNLYNMPCSSHKLSSCRCPRCSPLMTRELRWVGATKHQKSNAILIYTYIYTYLFTLYRHINKESNIHIYKCMWLYICICEYKYTDLYIKFMGSPKLLVASQSQETPYMSDNPSTSGDAHPSNMPPKILPPIG